MVVAAYAIVVFVFSVIPTGAGPSVPHLDKVVHLCEYLLFAWLLVQAIRASQEQARAYLLWAWIYATSYGLLMELIQMMVPWRSADLADALANALGAALGVWLGQRTGRFYFPSRSRVENRNVPKSMDPLP